MRAAPSLVVVSALFAAAAFASWLAMQGTGGLPLGPDAGLWLMAARVRQVGGTVALPPLWPSLVAWAGGSVGAARWINAGALVLASMGAGLGASLGARSGGTRLAAGVAGAVAGLLGVRLYAFVWFTQPEVLTGAALVWVGVAGAWALARPSGLRMVAWGLACGVAMATREHGLVATALGLVLAALAPPGGVRERALRVLAMLVGVQLAWGVASGRPLIPFFIDNASLDKALLTFTDSASLSAGSLGLERAPPDMPAGTLEGARGAGLLGSMLGRAWRISGPEHLGLQGAALGLALLSWRRRWWTGLGLLMPSLTVLPSVLVWTQWRHFAVLGPAAAALMVAGVAAALEARAPRRAPLLVAVMGLGLALAGGLATARGVGMVRARIAQQQDALRPAVHVAAWLREHTPDGALYAGDHRVGAMAGLLPSPVPPGTPPSLGSWPDLGWRTWIVAEHGVRPVSPWREVHQEGRFTVWHPEPPAEVDEDCLWGVVEGTLGDDFPRLQRQVALGPGCASDR